MDFTATGLVEGAGLDGAGLAEAAFLGGVLGGGAFAAFALEGVAGSDVGLALTVLAGAALGFAFGVGAFAVGCFFGVGFAAAFLAGAGFFTGCGAGFLAAGLEGAGFALAGTLPLSLNNFPSAEVALAILDFGAGFLAAAFAGVVFAGVVFAFAGFFATILTIFFAAALPVGLAAGVLEDLAGLGGVRLATGFVALFLAIRACTFSPGKR